MRNVKMSKIQSLRAALLSGVFVSLSLLGMVSSANALMVAPGTPLATPFAPEPFVTTGGKWGPSLVPGTPGGEVTWSLMTSGLSCAGPFENPMCVTTELGPPNVPAGFKAVLENAFKFWSDVADISFVEVADSGDPFNTAGATGDIRIAMHVFDGPGGVLAHGFFPPTSPFSPSAVGDIHFDIAETWLLGDAGMGPGFNFERVAAHEIGHAIGLDHEEGVPALMNPVYNEGIPSGLLPDDIAGAQAIYGPNPVPTPSAMLLMGTGLIGLVGFRWWSNKKA